MSRECPRCLVPFDSLKKPFATIDVCPRCQGIFLDPGEGMALHGADSDPSFLVKDGRAKEVGDSTLVCPNRAHATRRMRVYEVGQGEGSVEIDHCPLCAGVFLDHGEAEALEAHVNAKPTSPFAVEPTSNHDRAIALAQAELDKPAFSSTGTPTVASSSGSIFSWLLGTGDYGRRQHHPHHRHSTRPKR
ncbi:MAG: zf-TFIIB domain-containing protein [Sandaracinaceae bacterium]|nr:zf-TFIIB domain-containing protein [Sandaracinaceae bacterium]